MLVADNCLLLCIFFFKQKTAYEMRISDWSSDVCSSDLEADQRLERFALGHVREASRDVDGLGRVAQCLGPRVLERPRLVQGLHELQIGRASCRERVGQYV